MKNESESFLADNGCCPLCIDIFHGSRQDTYDSFFFQSLNGEVDGSHTNELSEVLVPGSVATLETEDKESKSDLKRKRLSTCPTCLGILQNCLARETLNELSGKIMEEQSDSPFFSLTITLPVCLSIRIHSMWLHFLKKFPHIEARTIRDHHYGTLKDTWRQITGAKLAELVSKEFVPPENASFVLSVIAEYKKDEEECACIEPLDQKTYAQRREQHKKYIEGLYSRNIVSQTIQRTKDNDFLTIFSSPPNEAPCGVTFENSKCSHAALYIAGRYNKYSRELSQTPWFVEGERRAESSVEELISSTVETELRTRCVFSSSGREDVDVRCLGTGRPFVLECLNPRKTQLSDVYIRELQNEINGSTSCIRVKDMQVVTKNSVTKMKEGEEEKCKTYIALCLSREGLSNLDLSQLNKTKDLVINQVTPLRVLHRRPLATRQRCVHSMDVEVVDQYFFKLTLVADAGTYIKEFVHGDFGRTTPNLGSMLKAKFDIVALDVINVKLDWPPQLDP